MLVIYYDEQFCFAAPESEEEELKKVIFGYLGVPVEDLDKCFQRVLRPHLQYTVSANIVRSGLIGEAKQYMVKGQPECDIEWTDNEGETIDMDEDDDDEEECGDVCCSCIEEAGCECCPDCGKPMCTVCGAPMDLIDDKLQCPDCSKDKDKKIN